MHQSRPTVRYRLSQLCTRSEQNRTRGRGHVHKCSQTSDENDCHPLCSRQSRTCKSKLVVKYVLKFLMANDIKGCMQTCPTQNESPFHCAPRLQIFNSAVSVEWFRRRLIGWHKLSCCYRPNKLFAYLNYRHTNTFKTIL